MSSDRDRFLAIYLNDHLAGATVGVELARRVAASNEDDPIGEPLAEVRDEIEADFEMLKRLMDDLGVGRSKLKPAGAWAAEKVGRLKLNGQLTGYSPLSRMVELEGLALGINGKSRLWRALAQSFGGRHRDFDFEQLAERADRQRATVEELHLQAAGRALPHS
jgi:hypothetical protein